MVVQHDISVNGVRLRVAQSVGVAQITPLGVISYIDIMPKLFGYSFENPGGAKTVNGGSGLNESPSVSASSLTEPTAFSNVGGIAEPFIEFSKISNLAHAYFEIWTAAYGAGNSPTTDNVAFDLYDLTHTASISGTSSNANSSASAWVKTVSGDIKANLPTSDSALTVRLYDTSNTGNSAYVGLARLKLMW